MEVHTAQFGPVSFDPRDIYTFPQGIYGFELCRRWLLLGTAIDQPIRYLQSVERAQLALPVVTPSQFVPEYRVRVAAEALAPLALERDRDLAVLAVLNPQHDPTVNLKAPLLLNLCSRIGLQVIADGDWSIRHSLGIAPPARRKAA